MFEKAGVHFFKPFFKTRMGCFSGPMFFWWRSVLCDKAFLPVPFHVPWKPDDVEGAGCCSEELGVHDGIIKAHLVPQGLSDHLNAVEVFCVVYPFANGFKLLSSCVHPHTPNTFLLQSLKPGFFHEGMGLSVLYHGYSKVLMNFSMPCFL